MDVRSISRKAVGGCLKVARMPVDAALKLAGRGKQAEPAVDRAEAAARDVAGAAIGDDELRRDADLRRTAADRREQAQDLRDAAATQRKDATKRATAKRSTAERNEQAARGSAA